MLRYTICLAAVSILLGGCGINLGDRVVAGGGAVSISPPIGWAVDEPGNDGTVVIKGDGGRLSVVVLDAPPPKPEPGRLMDTLRAMSPGLEVMKQEDFSADAGRGKEFLISYVQKGRRQNGVVYLFPKNGKLCVLTFVVEGSLEDQLDVFRASAGTLRFQGS